MAETKRGWWKVNFEITLEGKDVRFFDLDEATQEHIAERIKDGFVGGEIIEEEKTDEEQDDETAQYPCTSCGNGCATCERR